MLKKIKSFFIKIVPSKRRIIQLYAALLYNANIKGFISGEIFKGNSKTVCLPGLNCYSCPGAIGACPLGALQNALAESKTKLPTYVLGIILLYSIILGRTICGFLCPIGLFQELLYKIKSPKLRKSKITRILSYFKYVLLFVLVIVLPIIYGMQTSSIPVPAFCKYICPAGTFEGAIFILANPNNSDRFAMLGALFTWKFILLMVFVVTSVFVYRFFCRFFCPLGALYGLFNKLSILGVKVDKSKCNHCQACVNHCKMDVKEVGDHECIQCGDCKSVCHCNAIDWKLVRKLVKEDIKEETSDDILENNELNIDNTINNINIKKNYRLNKNLFNIIIGSIMSITLIIVLLVVNFNKEILEVNDVCEDLKLELIDDSTFDISDDDNCTLLYFFNELNNEEINILNSYANEKLSIIVICCDDNADYEVLTNILSNSQIKLAKKGNSIVLNDFNKSMNYPFSVFMNYQDKILVKKNALISEIDYINIVAPTISGAIIGNEVGNVCINQEINIINSTDNETFSVAGNLGKITVINFWATWCGPCVQELPHFDEVYKEYKEDVTVIAIHDGVSYSSSVDTYVKQQFTDKGYEILFGYDSIDSGYFKALGGTDALPFTIIVDKEGIITYAGDKGSMTKQELIDEIEKILNK